MLSLYAFVESLCGRLRRESESGQGLSEYALILGLIALVAIAAVTGFGQALVSKLYNATNSL